MEKKKSNTIEDNLGQVIGNNLSNATQNASNTGVSGMNLFQQKIASMGSTQFEQAKGGLFEYIEAAKFNVDAAAKGSNAKAIITDAVGRPHAEADIEIYKDGVKVKDIQAKFIKTSIDGRDNSAASSVHHQTGAHNKGWGQYDGMERLIRKQEHYNENGSLLDEAKKLARERAKTGIHKDTYADVEPNLTDETHYENVSSGGTTYEEAQKAYDNPEKYIKDFENKQFTQEILTTTASMAAASFVTTGVVSSVVNFYKVFKNEKTFSEAVADTAKSAVKSGVRGAATGAVSSSIRIAAVKSGNKVLSDSTASLAIAGGIIDCGVSLLSYAKGEIDSKMLKEDLIASVVKSTSLVFFSNALKAIYAGASINPFVSMTSYIVLGLIIDNCKEIIRKARLHIEECERLIALYDASTIEIEKQYQEAEKYFDELNVEQKTTFNGFINRFNTNFDTDGNYDEAILALVELSSYLGIELQHIDFDDFSAAMESDNDFELK